MNVWIASDIHGSALYCRKLLDLMEKRGADRLVLLGDLLYHGPRNDLPEGYDPKAVFAMLNSVKERILCVHGTVCGGGPDGAALSHRGGLPGWRSCAAGGCS